jgi:hypothetical protein
MLEESRHPFEVAGVDARLVFVQKVFDLTPDAHRFPPNPNDGANT